MKLIFENGILSELLGKVFYNLLKESALHQKATKKFTVTVEDLKKVI